MDGKYLNIIDPSDGSILDSADGGFNGGVIMDRLGGLYVQTSDGAGNEGLVAFGLTVPVTLSAFEVD